MTNINDFEGEDTRLLDGNITLFQFVKSLEDSYDENVHRELINWSVKVISLLSKIDKMSERESIGKQDQWRIWQISSRLIEKIPADINGNEYTILMEYIQQEINGIIDNLLPEPIRIGIK